jgi:hypothetical protein
VFEKGATGVFFEHIAPNRRTAPRSESEGPQAQAPRRQAVGQATAPYSSATFAQLTTFQKASM